MLFHNPALGFVGPHYSLVYALGDPPGMLRRVRGTCAERPDGRLSCFVCHPAARAFEKRRVADKRGDRLVPD